jgi:hypothetical protein
MRTLILALRACLRVALLTETALALENAAVHPGGSIALRAIESTEIEKRRDDGTGRVPW